MAPPGRSSVSDIRSRGRRARLSGPHAKAPMEGATQRTFRFIPDLLRDCRDGESGSGQFTSGKIEPQSGKKCEWCQPRRPLEHAHKTGARGIGACGKFVQGPAFRGIIQHRGHRPPSLPMRKESQSPLSQPSRSKWMRTIMTNNALARSVAMAAAPARALSSSSLIADISIRRRAAAGPWAPAETTISSGSAVSTRLSGARSKHNRPHMSAVSGSPLTFDLSSTVPSAHELIPNGPGARPASSVLAQDDGSYAAGRQRRPPKERPSDRAHSIR